MHHNLLISKEEETCPSLLPHGAELLSLYKQHGEGVTSASALVRSTF